MRGDRAARSSLRDRVNRVRDSVLFRFADPRVGDLGIAIDAVLLAAENTADRFLHANRSSIDEVDLRATTLQVLEVRHVGHIDMSPPRGRALDGYGDEAVAEFSHVPATFL